MTRAFSPEVYYSLLRFYFLDENPSLHGNDVFGTTFFRKKEATGSTGADIQLQTH